MITDPDHALTFGELDLLGADQTGPYWFETTGEGTTFGNPVPVVRVVASLLMDGALEETESHDNREPTLRICVKGQDSNGLALGEAALFAEVAKGRNTLVWTPPDVAGPGTPCVFDVVNASLDANFDDIDELYLQRVYLLTIKALPFARSATITEVVSSPPSGSAPTVTSVDACAATTGWSIGPGGVGTVATDGTGIYDTVGASAHHSTGHLDLQKTFSVSMAAGTLVRIDWALTRTGPVTFGAAATTVMLNGVVVEPVAANGSVRYYPRPSSGTLTSVRMYRYVYDSGAGGVGKLRIADISITNSSTDSLAGARQSYRNISLGGSVRTQGNLALEDPTVALGSVLVYTVPNSVPVVQPPLRTLRTSGSAETPDTSVVSGKFSDLATLHTFDIASPLVPNGGYLLYARVKHATAGDRAITWAGRSRMGSINLGTGQTGSKTVTLAAATWTIVEVAKMTLPGDGMGPSGLVRIELSGPAGLLLDEAWLFNVDSGQLTWVECGTGTPAPGGPANRLWLDAASLDSPVPTVWVGNAADRSDAFGPGLAIRSFGQHEFWPETNVFTVNANSVATTVTASGFPRYHTNVVEP